MDMIIVGLLILTCLSFMNTNVISLKYINFTAGGKTALK